MRLPGGIIASAVGALVLVHCSSFTGTPAPIVDAGLDGAEPTSDAATTLEDASIDANQPCGDTPTLGSDQLPASLVADTIPYSSIDAYGFEATGPRLRCVHIYLENLSPSNGSPTAVLVGIYDDVASPTGDDGDVPSDLRGTAIVTNPKIGWNVAAIDTPLDNIGPGTRFWLATKPNAGIITIRRQTSGCAHFGHLYTHLEADSYTTMLPQPFGNGVSEDEPSCKPSIFVSD